MNAWIDVYDTCLCMNLRHAKPTVEEPCPHKNLPSYGYGMSGAVNATDSARYGHACNPDLSRTPPCRDCAEEGGRCSTLW